MTAANVAAANKDGTPATASLRTLGKGAQQAAAGNDPRLSKGVVGPRESGLSGPLPTTPQSFNTRAGSELLITWSGTASHSAAQGGGLGGFRLLIDGKVVDSTVLYFNVTDTHLTFPTSEAVLINLSPGSHTIAFDGDPALPITADTNDRYFFTIVKVQFNP